MRRSPHRVCNQHLRSSTPTILLCHRRYGDAAATKECWFFVHVHKVPANALLYVPACSLEAAALAALPSFPPPCAHAAETCHAHVACCPLPQFPYLPFAHPFPYPANPSTTSHSAEAVRALLQRLDSTGHLGRIAHADFTEYFAV